ncbi:DUF11 domain-containing protein [Streptomyces tubercidicus]|uniref:DUF11 domain-containing protein n=1 Tax=Streptomyces tubercidicus TaxID=47759 RepID=UPI0036886360
MGLAPACVLFWQYSQRHGVRMFTSQRHGVRTPGGRGERTEREGGTRGRITAKVVRGVLASALFSFSALSLAAVDAPAAHAVAGTQCEPSVSSTSDGWTHTGAWTFQNNGWFDANEFPGPDILSRDLSDLPTNGAQITFDHSWDWADTGGGSQQTDLTLSYAGTVYATLHSPGPNVNPRVGTVSASHGASISPTTGTSQGKSATYTVTLPDGVPTSGKLKFSMSTGTSEGGAGYVNNISVANIKATSTNCADFAVTKSGPAAVRPGGSVKYTIDVTNSGPSKDTYTVSDTLPAGLAEPTTSTRGCTIASGTLTCTGTALPVGSKRTITVQGKAPATDGSTLSNTASVKGTLTDQDTSDNTSKAVNTTVDAKLVEPSATPVQPSSAAHPPARDPLPGREQNRDGADSPGHQAAHRAESGPSGHQGSPSNVAVNTGIPSAAGTWSLAFGIVLLLCGGLGLSLAVRAHGLRIRTFPG